MRRWISRNLLAANARVEGWGALGSVVSKVRDSLKTLQDGTAFRTRSATVGTTGTGRSLGAISNVGTAAPGRYQVEVQNLAQSEKLTGTAVAEAVQRRAAEVLRLGGIATPEGRAAGVALDKHLRSDGNKLNPGTTADLITACLFVALRENKVTPSAPFRWQVSDWL